MSKPITKTYREKLIAIQPLAAEAAQRLNRTLIVDEYYTPPDKWCNKCQSFYPPTDDFFYRSVSGLFRSPCKACINEQKQEACAVKSCAVPGCTNPRHQSRSGRYYAYCAAHNKKIVAAQAVNR